MDKVTDPNLASSYPSRTGTGGFPLDLLSNITKGEGKAEALNSAPAWQDGGTPGNSSAISDLSPPLSLKAKARHPCGEKCCPSEHQATPAASSELSYRALTRFLPCVG